MVRQPVGICETSKGLMVACEDGTVWMHLPETGVGEEATDPMWIQIEPAIPGSDADRSPVEPILRY
jgi:hypothetical protein